MSQCTSKINLNIQKSCPISKQLVYARVLFYFVCWSVKHVSHYNGYNFLPLHRYLNIAMGIYGKYTIIVKILSSIQMGVGILMISLGIAFRIFVCSWVTDASFGFWIGGLVNDFTKTLILFLKVLALNDYLLNVDRSK